MRIESRERFVSGLTMAGSGMLRAGSASSNLGPGYLLGLVTVCLLAAPLAFSAGPGAEGRQPSGSAEAEGERYEGITLDEARTRVESSSLALEVSSLRRDAAEAAVLQAGRLKNPTVELELENIGLDLPTTDMVETTVVLGQAIELGGKRRLRVETARAEQRLVSAEGEALRQALLAQADMAFIGLLASQKRLEIFRQGIETAGSVASTVRHLVDAGEVSPIELPRVESEVALLEAELSRIEAEAVAAGARLAALWGGVQSPPAIGNLGGLLADEIVAELGARLEAHPRVRRLAAEADRADVFSRSVRRQVVPDLELMAGYRRFADTDQSTMLIGARLSIPLWDRGRGAISEAEALAAAARKERQAELVWLASELRAARVELAQAELEVVLVAERMVPRATEVFEAVSAGYSLGEMPLLDLLDARRALTAARARLVDAYERRALARAEIVRLTPGHGLVSGGES